MVSIAVLALTTGPTSAAQLPNLHNLRPTPSPFSTRPYQIKFKCWVDFDVSSATDIASIHSYPITRLWQRDIEDAGATGVAARLQHERNPEIWAPPVKCISYATVF